MLATFSLVGLWSVAARGLDPAARCEADKLKTAGKYGFCRFNAESKAAKTFSTPDFSRCDGKFSLKWSSAETRAGGQCPTEGDEAALQAFIAQHTDDVTAALAGTPLPNCDGDLATCNGSLSTCASSLGSCTTSLALCNAGLTVAAADLMTVNAGTAAQADVLSGKTFSSGAGLGLTGTMANNGAVSIMPGTTSQMIPAGFHNGAGTVAGDTDLVAGNIVSGVSIFGVTGSTVVTVSAQPLRTGQTQCDQGDGTVGACPGSPAGQDASALNGAARSYTDNGNGTITDNATGLMWEKLSGEGIHNGGATYTWFDAFNVKIAALNAGGGFAGHTDWRLPNRFELETLLDLGHVNPAINPAFNMGCVSGCTVLTCSCTPSLYYWPSTTDLSQGNTAFTVGFYFGTVERDSKFETHSVRAVRGGL